MASLIPELAWSPFTKAQRALLARLPSVERLMPGVLGSDMGPLSKCRHLFFHHETISSLDQ